MPVARASFPFVLALGLLMAVGASACAPTGESPASPTQPMAADDAVAAAPAVAPTPSDPSEGPAPATPPLAPTVEAPAAPPAGATAGEAPVKLDMACSTSADCAVKDVGNCCGYYPACVNKDSPTDPAAVKAACQASGMMATCGFREIQSCQCVQGRCEAQDSAGPQLQ